MAGGADEGPRVDTLRLITAGFHGWIFQNRGEKQTALRPMDAYTLPSHPTVPDVPLR